MSDLFYGDGTNEFLNGSIMLLRFHNCHLNFPISKHYFPKHLILDPILSNKGHWLEVKEKDKIFLLKIFFCNKTVAETFCLCHPVLKLREVIVRASPYTC